MLVVCISQDGNSLMNILQPYLDTGVNLTTFRFRYEGSSEDLAASAGDDGRYDDDSLATVYDSLLTLYHGVRLQASAAGGGCQWAGSNLLSTLATVITVSILPFTVLLTRITSTRLLFIHLVHASVANCCRFRCFLLKMGALMHDRKIRDRVTF